MENGSKGISMDKGCIFTSIKMSILGDGLMARNMEMEHMSSMLQQWNMLGNGLKVNFWRVNGSIQMEHVMMESSKIISPKVLVAGISWMAIKLKDITTKWSKHKTTKPYRHSSYGTNIDFVYIIVIRKYIQIN